MKDFFHLYAGDDVFARSRLQIFRKMQGWFEGGIISHDGDWLRVDPDYQVSEETWVLYMQAC